MIIIHGILLVFVGKLAVEDWKTKLLSNKVLCVMAAGGALLCPFNSMATLSGVLAGMVGIGGGLALLSRISDGQVGMGDAKLFACISLYLGFGGTLIVLIYAMIFAALAGLTLLLFKRADRRTPIPFVPFVLAGIAAEMASEMASKL